MKRASAICIVSLLLIGMILPASASATIWWAVTHHHDHSVSNNYESCINYQLWEGTNNRRMVYTACIWLTSLGYHSGKEVLIRNEIYNTALNPDYLIDSASVANEHQAHLHWYPATNGRNDGKVFYEGYGLVHAHLQRKEYDPILGVGYWKGLDSCYMTF